jgi:internalin A
MSTDLDIIKQLEQKTHKLFKKVDKIRAGSACYVQNEHNQITGLGFYPCNLKKLPPVILELQNLTVLDLGSNQLRKLPPEIVKLQNLNVLNLASNKLIDFPPEIVELQNLTVLDLSNQYLSDLPSEIVKLKNLTRLNLEENRLSQFPKALLKLNLEVKWEVKWDNQDEGILVKNNPFQTPPVEIVEQGRQAIIDYYAALKGEQKRPLNESKLILIGDGGVGKTSLMKRLLGLDFNQQESQTHGININTLTLQYNDNDIKLHCWDFGGQQIMHATHQFFLSKRSLYLLVLDSRRETQVDYWLKHIQTFGKNAPVIIVINKIDENPHFDLPQQRQLKKRYPNFKQVCRISCATLKGISELNRTIQNTLPDIELLNTPFPPKWFKVKTAITEQTKKTNFTSYEHYVDICQANGITKESEQNTLINFLHDLGIVNHFQDRWLRETNVINPQWITEAVYTIINAPQLAGNGKLHRELLSTLLDNNMYPVRKHDYIIELMKKFELCYAINDNEYLLPDLFPTQEPDFEFDDEHALHFILEYDFLPKSIFTRFIVRMHRDILDNTYWRNGVLLGERASNTTALVETDSNRLVLQITGSQKREYLAILLFILKDINRSFNNLKITEKIGLPDNPSLTVNHAYLLKLVQKGQTEYLPPENPEKSYNVMDLLGLVTPPKISETEMLQMLQKILSILETQGIEQKKDLLDHIDEVVKLNPGLFGMSIDVNALVKKLLKK